MLTPEYFSISPSTQKGDCYATEFIASATNVFSPDFTKFTWDLGNGVFKYNDRTVSFSYDYPGIYVISLSAWNTEGVLITDKAEVDVDYAYRDVMTFSRLPSAYGTPGLPTISPFVVSLTSSKIKEDLSIVLQALNTKSIPHYAVPEKWNFLTPTWKFIDASTNEILDGPIVLKKEPIYKDSKIVGTKAEASFYYVDDLSTGQDLNNSCPLLLVATLSTENFQYPPESLIYPYFSYSNSEVTRAVIAWQVNDVIPTRLKVTENYLNDVYPVKWAGIPIPVMVTCEFDPSLLNTFSSSDTQSTKVLAYPRSNELGSASPVTIVLSSAEQGVLSKGVDFEVEEDLYFQATDANNNVVNGYVFTTITPLCSLSSTLVVAVSTLATNQSGEASIASFGFPDGYPIYPDVYISNPFKSNINKLNIVTYPATCENINYYKNLGVLIEGTASFVDVPVNRTFELSSYSLSGTAGVYGMAFNPTINRLYATDADQDTLFALSNGTNLVGGIQLSSVTGYDNNVPSYISIDGFGNLWVSLYGHERLLKFDPSLNYLLSAAPPVSLGSFDSGSPLVAPPVVETDFDSNIWACYAHPLQSMLVKFNGSNGQFLLSAAELSLSSVPVSLSINVNNDVWVACREINTLELYSGSTGTRIQTLSGLFYRPSYTAMDRGNNIWFTHGHDFCGVYNTTTSTFSSWRFNSQTNTVTPVLSYTQADVELALNDNEIWGGIAVDVFNRVWVIDSQYNTVWAFNPSNPVETSRPFVVIPEPDTNYVVIGGSTYITQIPDDTVRSAQAAGDWTGNKWYQKYAGSGITSLIIKGQSSPFRVYDLNNSFQIAKVNEEFDTAGYFKSLALPEVLSQNTKLFDEFLSAVAGDGNPTKEDAGRVIYERIANFINNHGDFQTAEINQLLSMANQLSINAQTFGSDFPEEINRLLNLFSVPKHLLRGLPNFETDLQTNVGALLTEGTMVSAGQYLFMKDKLYERYQIIYVTELSPGLTSYPIEQLELEGVRLPIMENYYFFEYNEQQAGYKNNLINWDSEYTTVEYSLSTNNEWYGDDGLVEIMFNNLLTKRLFQE